MDVALVHWPAEADRLERLRERREPRLVVVEEGPPPTTEDWLEDWLRTPVDEEEIRIRLETLRARARQQPGELTLDEGVLRSGAPRRRAPADPGAARRARCSNVRTRSSAATRCLRRGWPDEKPKDRNVLDVHMARLRRLIAPTGLQIHTVHRRGYLLRIGEVGSTA